MGWASAPTPGGAPSLSGATPYRESGATPYREGGATPYREGGVTPYREGGATPYREENEFDGYPASVGPGSVRGDEEEERGEEETQEEFEDRVLNKRAAHLNKILSSKLESSDSVVRLSDMTRRNTRKQ